MDLTKYYNLKEEFYSNKTEEYKKKFGQFFTPIEIVEFMCQYIPNNINNLKVLEPAFGMGIFSHYMLNSNKIKIDNIKAFELDSKLKPYNEQLFNNHSEQINIDYSDFLNSTWNEKFDFIIANPPYYKFRHIENREDLQKIFQSKTKTKFDITTNIYNWFLIKSINQLTIDGKLCFIIPSDFLNSNSGVKVKNYLLKKNILERIIKFSFKTKIFDDAITTSCILMINNNKIDTNVYFSTIHTIEELVKPYSDIESKKYNNSDLDPEKKWSSYFHDRRSLITSNLMSFSQVGKIKRGIATGDNNYFLFNKSRAKKYNISPDCLIPCICNTSYMKNIKILDDNTVKRLIDEDNKILLFSGIYEQNIHDKEYILAGEELEVNKKSLPSKRKPWYKHENKETADFFVSVFNRNQLNIIKNDSSVLNLTCYHGLYLDDISDDDKKLLFLYLNSYSAYELFILEERECGNGLNKFEPNDLNKSHILNIDKILKKDKSTLLNLADQYLKNPSEDILFSADQIFGQYIFE